MEIARYLLFPLRPAPLFLIVAFSCLLGIASSAGFLGIPLGFILLSWFSKYSFVLFDSAAQGKAEPPVLAIEMVNPIDEQRPLLLLLLAIAVFFVSDAVSYWLGTVAATLTALTAVAILPAVIAVQGATGSVLQSLNPAIAVRLIGRLRGAYARILIFAALFAGLSWMIANSRIGTALPTVVRIALWMYFWLTGVALIGGTLFVRRADLGLDATYAPERLEMRADAELARRRDRQVDRIYAEWRGGSHANAWQTVEGMINSSADPLEELRWLYARAARWPDPRLANRLARELLPRLLVSRHFSEALAVLRARIHSDTDFRPLTSSELLMLIRLARDAGDRPTARALLKDFARFYPDDKEQRAVAALARQLER